MGILKKFSKTFILFLLGTIVVLIVVWLWQGSFRDLEIQPREEEESEPITTSTQQNIKEAMFYKKLFGNWVQCQLCFRKCTISEGGHGFCRARVNQGGILYSLVYALPSAIHIDPIEKEPQLHHLPGTNILCIGTVCCNFQCQHCHNWHLSQASPGELRTYYLPPEKVVELAIKEKIPTISYTYNEPTVCYEYLYDVAVLAKEKGLRIIWHSNGAINPEPLRKLLKYTDGVTIDLKGFTEKAYKNSSAELDPVLRTLKIIREEEIWLEIVNLVIPTINDEEEDIKRMCEWIKKNLGYDIPLHFSRFSPAYKLTKLPPTPIGTLEKAYDIAKNFGLYYVTIGNVPGHKYNSTFCPNCSKCLIHRIHFQVIENNIVNGKCKFCGYEISGIWR